MVTTENSLTSLTNITCNAPPHILNTSFYFRRKIYSAILRAHPLAEGTKYTNAHVNQQ
jgi:hypothetical protein